MLVPTWDKLGFDVLGETRREWACGGSRVGGGGPTSGLGTGGAVGGPASVDGPRVRLAYGRRGSRCSGAGARLPGRCRGVSAGVPFARINRALRV